MKSLFALLLFGFFKWGYGTDCNNLVGTWRNELGSNMTIQLEPDSNRITGRYYTAVESTKGAARLSSNISGLFLPSEEGSLVAFNVLFNKGASLSAWVGQCLVCGGKEKIYTTWVLRSLQPQSQRWMTTRINQDTFWRVQDGDFLLQDPDSTIESSSNGLNAASQGLNGTWTSSTSDSFTINTDWNIGTWNGIHFGQVGSGNQGNVYGFLDGNATYEALGFAAGTELSHTITGWVGHIYDPESQTKVLETSWLKHTLQNDCANPRKLVQFGMYNYTQV